MDPTYPQRIAGFPVVIGRTRTEPQILSIFRAEMGRTIRAHHQAQEGEAGSQGRRLY